MPPKSPKIDNAPGTMTVTDNVTGLMQNPATNTSLVEVAPPAVPALPGHALSMDDIGKRGEQSQRQIASATQSIVAAAKLSDMDELGDLLGQTLSAAKGYDPSKITKGRWFGFVKAKIEQIRQNYESADTTVQRLVGELDKRLMTFRQRVGDLERIASSNHQYHDSLTGDIVNLRECVAWMEANRPTVDPTDSFSAQHAQEWETVINYATKRADDLGRAQVVSQQQDAQIRLMQQNSRALAQKFDDLKVTTLPLLQQTFSLYIINVEAKRGAEFAGEIDDLTDRTMKENARQLGQNTTIINTALTRSNISLEAIEANHKAVVESLDEIQRIRGEMRNRLASEAPQLEQASRDLAARLALPAPTR